MRRFQMRWNPERPYKKPPLWICRLRRHVMETLPKIYGPRGMIMLGKALMACCFGISYLGVLAPRPQPGLEMVLKFLPLQGWAVVWFIVAFMLVAGAFKVDQSKALGSVAAMLSLWSLSFLDYFFRMPILSDGTQNTAFVSFALLASLALSAAGCARMMNHAPSHTELVQKPGDEPSA